MPEVSHELEGPEAPDVEIEALDWPDQVVLAQADNLEAWISCDQDSAIENIEESI